MIKATLVGDDRVVLRFTEIHPAYHKDLVTRIRRKGLELVRYIKAGKLSGQALKTKTGTTRRKINFKLEVTDTSVLGSAGLGMEKAKYPAVHEYGGAFTVKEHLRKIKQAFGRPLKEPKTVTVKAHSATFPERSFLRSALRDMEAEIRADLAEAGTGIKGRW